MKKIVIDNDTKKVVNEEIYKEHKKSKSKTKDIVITLFIVLIGTALTWTFISLYQSVSDNDFLKGDWQCSNGLNIKFEKHSYEFMFRDSTKKGSYILNKSSEKDGYKYYLLKLTGDTNEDYVIIRDNNEIILTNDDGSQNIECKIKK